MFALFSRILKLAGPYKGRIQGAFACAFVESWLVLIAYLTGLSIGVHLLNLLCIPAIVLVYYYKKNPDANLKGSLLTSIPIGYYHASPDDDCSFPSILEDPSVFKGILSGFRHFTKNPDYFIAQSFSYYGYIKPEHADCVIIIGPVFSTPISDLTLRTFMQEWAISQEHKPDILQFLVNIPQISFNQFLQP